MCRLAQSPLLFKSAAYSGVQLTKALNDLIEKGFGNNLRSEMSKINSKIETLPIKIKIEQIRLMVDLLKDQCVGITFDWLPENSGASTDFITDAKMIAEQYSPLIINYINENMQSLPERWKENVKVAYNCVISLPGVGTGQKKS